MNKKKIGILLVFILSIALFFVFLARSAKKQTTAPAQTVQIPQNVSTQSAANSTTLLQTIQYPATVVGDQEIKITAKVAGNISKASFSLGDRVGTGTVLATIDDTGNTLQTGDEGLQSAQVQQSGLSLDQAAENVSLAKSNYHDLKQAYDEQKKNPSLNQTVSKAQVDAAKNQVDIAETQYTSIHIGFKSAIDNHLITSPISGFVTNKLVSVGDSVSAGQELYAISRTANLKIQFYVSQDELKTFSKGQTVTVSDNSGNNTKATIRNISPVADNATKRFLIEAFPLEKNSLLSGTVVSVTHQILQSTTAAGDLILPLSAINIGQNQSNIFILENNQAKAVPVTIQAVNGETAEIKTDLTPDAQIITSGSKLVQDGQQVQIQN